VGVGRIHEQAGQESVSTKKTSSQVSMVHYHLCLFDELVQWRRHRSQPLFKEEMSREFWGCEHY
jgi:hypothetical protein